MPGFTAEASRDKLHEKYTFIRDTAGGTGAGLVYPARFAYWRGMCACSGDDDCNGRLQSRRLCSLLDSRPG
jgi:hypothetical protein